MQQIISQLFQLNKGQNEQSNIIIEDDIPVIDKLRMNMGKYAFEKAVAQFPIRLDMSNDDEYVLAKDEYF